MSPEAAVPSFFLRLAMAFVLFWRILFKPRVAALLLPVYRGAPELPAPGGGPARAALEEPRPRAAPVPVEEPPEVRHASGLLVLSMLQREGRLIDFLQEEVAPFSDAEVGAAARIVHGGCRKVLRQLVDLEHVYKEGEGARVSVPRGFDANRVRLTGNVAGQAPYQGTLKHPGWAATAVRFPTVSAVLDARVLAPAEVELS
ncbi:MAG: DUF2760 domain-containing protein [Myxococcaceae bacterium]|nr:DUF2760 domain-containing protein [Myxococcaceae bacterium]MCI0671862.1 DUF2760 domain-containing protein [Myxococcaceae bacterium]